MDAPRWLPPVDLNIRQKRFEMLLLRGDRLLVDMTTGVSRVESDTGRVQGLFQSSGQGGPLIPGATPPATSQPGPGNSNNKPK